MGLQNKKVHKEITGSFSVLLILLKTDIIGDLVPFIIASFKALAQFILLVTHFKLS
jgi:hypothetical protein